MCFGGGEVKAGPLFLLPAPFSLGSSDVYGFVTDRVPDFKSVDPDVDQSCDTYDRNVVHSGPDFTGCFHMPSQPIFLWSSGSCRSH